AMQVSYAPRVRVLAIGLVMACSKATPPAPSAAPITNKKPTVPPDAFVPRCVATGAMIQSRIADDGVLACYLVPAPGEDVDCWRFDPKTGAWSFASREQRAVLENVPVQVTATLTSARVCKPDGSDCWTVPLSGIPPLEDPEDALVGTTNADRSLVAIWSRGGPIHVFGAGGKR